MDQNAALKSLGDSWLKALASFQTLGGADAKTPTLSFSPEKLEALQKQYMAEATELWNQSLQGKPEVKDRRFKGEAWAHNPMAAFTAAAYLLNTRTMMALTDAAETDAKTKARIQFAVEQWAAASAPSNYLALNADAQQKAIETKGESISKGIQNLLHDMQQGHVSMTDESLFEVGKNVATTEGAVVFENDYFQLIEYKPLTAKVYERPFLLVPPCINKFYILDLQPENSFIRYAVSQGHRCFVVSWRNPDDSMAKATWDDYIEQAAIKAIDEAMPRIEAYTASADALVHGCEAETFCLGAAEARASGVPVIVPDRGGAADHASGGAGLTYRANNPLALADAIEREVLSPIHPPRHTPITMRDHFATLFEDYASLLGQRRVVA